MIPSLPTDNNHSNEKEIDDAEVEDGINEEMKWMLILFQ